MAPAELTIIDHPGKTRFEAHLCGDLVGHIDYTKSGETVEFSHTEVDPRFEGRGIGSALVRGALDAAKTADLGVIPSCPFVHGWINTHPSYKDLLAK